MFSEYVDRSVRNAIRIQPRVRFASTYAGDEVEISFDEPLAENTTYTVTIGVDYRDLKGNAPRSATSFTFSTGVDIDTGRISGRVFGADIKKAFVFLYTDSLDQRFDPSTQLPSYALPVGASGTFAFAGLKAGQYRMVAVQDSNENNLLDPNEMYALASDDVVLRAEVKSESWYLLLGPSKAMQRLAALPADTTKLTAADSARRRLPPGSIEGTLRAVETSLLRMSARQDTSYVIRFLDSTRSVSALVPVRVGLPWRIAEILPGTYAVDLFVDLNGDQLFNHGRLLPFEFAEPWIPTTSVVSVRQRWTTEGVMLSAP